MQREAWGIMWHSKNSLDGERKSLVGISFAHGGAERFQPAGDSQATLTFKTKREAAAFIRRQFGYIAERKDLRAEPHGWRMPRPVKVRITVEPVSSDK